MLATATRLTDAPRGGALASKGLNTNCAWTCDLRGKYWFAERAIANNARGFTSLSFKAVGVCPCQPVASPFRAP